MREAYASDSATRLGKIVRDPHGHIPRSCLSNGSVRLKTVEFPEHGKNFAFSMGTTHKIKVLRKFVEEKWRSREDLCDRLDCSVKLREISSVCLIWYFLHSSRSQTTIDLKR